MGYVVKMPKLGLEMEQGTLLEWHVAEGESVEEGGTLAEVESEKSIGEVDAREDGVLRLIGVEEGETVPPGTPIGILAGPDEDIAELETEFGRSDEGSTGSSRTETDEAADSPSESDPETNETAPASADADVRASPRAERRADELGVEIATVDGTGPGGAITADDVEAAAERSASDAETADRGSDDTEPERIEATPDANYRARTYVSHGDEANTVIETAERASRAFDFDVSTTDVLLLAVSATLEDRPEFNATFEGNTHHVHDRQTIAVAPGADADGESGVSVIPAVGERTLADIAEATGGPNASADGGSEGPPTFLLAGEGGRGTDRGVPSPPTVAGLFADCSRRRATPAENGVVLDRYLQVRLTYDARAIGDGEAEAFLESLLEQIGRASELVLRTYR